AEPKSSRKLPRIRRKLARKRVELSRLCHELDVTPRQFDHLAALVCGAVDHSRNAKAAVTAARSALERKKTRKTNQDELKRTLRKANRHLTILEAGWRVSSTELERALVQLRTGDAEAGHARDEMV